MKMLLSIIVPVYNAEKFIERCLKSILNQCNDLSGIELLVINDGSTDNSSTILKKLSEENSIIKLYSQENKGEGYTRNIGLDYANGEYICFVDSDDFLEGDIIKKIYSLLTNTEDIELIIYGMKRITENGKIISKVEFKDEETNAQELLSKLIYTNSVCNKVFKLKNIKENNIKFNTIVKTATDFDFSFRMLFFSKKIITISGSNYNYIVNPDSVSNVRTPEHLERLAIHSTIIGNDLKSFLKLNKNTSNKYKIFMPWLNNYLYGLLLSLFRFNYKDKVIIDVLNLLRKKDNYPIDYSKMPVKKKFFVMLANKPRVFLFLCHLNRKKNF